MTKIKRYIDYINESLIESNVNKPIPLPQDIIDISNAYINAGKEIFLVGGAVRDFIQGIKPKDWDLVTNALPDESKKILKGFRVSDEQGKNFGVLRVYTKDEPLGYEVASYRKDISGGRDTKGDDQKVEMGEHITIQDDCNRRDLTINALFYDIKNKKIVDLVGGVEDIKKGIIRTVGEASDRFFEDRLRILRIFRFAARTGGTIDEGAVNAIKNDNRLKNISSKEDVSQERIWEEIVKAWGQAKDFNRYLDFFTEFDMWDEVFPGVTINTDLVDSSNFLIVITNLFKNESTKGLEKKLVQDFKIESRFAMKIIFLLNLSLFQTEFVIDFYKKKEQCFIDDESILEWFDINDVDDNTRKFIKFKPSVNANDLMSKGFKGRELGLEIKRLEIEKYNEL